VRYRGASVWAIAFNVEPSGYGSTWHLEDIGLAVLTRSSQACKGGSGQRGTATHRGAAELQGACCWVGWG